MSETRLGWETPLPFFLIIGSVVTFVGMQILMNSGELETAWSLGASLKYTYIPLLGSGVFTLSMLGLAYLREKVISDE